MTDDDGTDPGDFLDPRDPLIQSIVERAASRYEGRLTPEALDECRRLLSFLLATHPDASKLVRRALAELAAGSGTQERRDPARLAEVRTGPKKRGSRGG